MKNKFNYKKLPYWDNIYNAIFKKNTSTKNIKCITVKKTLSCGPTVSYANCENHKNTAILIDEFIDRTDYESEHLNDIFFKNINDIIRFNHDHGTYTDTMVIYKKVLKTIMKETGTKSKEEIMDLYNSTFTDRYKITKIIVI